MFKIIRKQDQFEEFKEDWNKLWQLSPNATFFQTYDYNIIASERFIVCNNKNELHVLIHSNGDNVIDSIFPFYIDSSKRLRFINDIHTDFCDALFLEGINHYSVIEELYQHIQKEKRISGVFLDNLSDASPLLPYLKVFMQNAFVFSQTEHSYIKCNKSDNPISSLTHLNAKERNRLNNNYKKSKGTELIIFAKDNNEYPENDLIFLKQQMIDKKIRSGSYLDEKMFAFIKELYLASLIEIPILYENNSPVSAGIIFINKKNSYAMRWIILYRESKYNLWNNIHYFINKVYVENITIDFGRGGYDYKMQNFKPDVKNLYRLMYSKTWTGNFYVFCKMNMSHFRKTLKLLLK